MLVYIVDDTKTIRTIIHKILAKNSYEVIEFDNCEEALEGIRIKKPDIVLTDLEIPEMGGLELITRIRAHEKFDDVKIIVVSAEYGMSDINACLLRGANQYITKPFTETALLQRINSVLTT